MVSYTRKHPSMHCNVANSAFISRWIVFIFFLTTNISSIIVQTCLKLITEQIITFFLNLFDWKTKSINHSNWFTIDWACATSWYQAWKWFTDFYLCLVCKRFYRMFLCLFLSNIDASRSISLFNTYYILEQQVRTLFFLSLSRLL